MAFSDDRGGLSFECADAKMSLGSSTWSTRISHIGRVSWHMYVMTRRLPGTDHISRIISKRPRDISIIANYEARTAAEIMKGRFPGIRVALHAKNNAKVVLITPGTVWVSGADFGEGEGSGWIDAAMGMHSEDLFRRTHEDLFLRLWGESREIQ
ncbi:hypothetical protein I5U90_06550 [Stenotrophomonas maltophilia]|uniref:hypothetical protein n=1 Tax=Stenotrophomonas maltophilia TaxID=40324 RepID=UPI0018D2F22C|nr:hypothetical protein [Stenotrophomonas maltophilia]MBH1672695.1 hypothetical protein [Stenotrophomonas maltophilia]MBH1856247.1 hypothetical protein [Stenotrophomonas maltophilia]MCU1134047.1 hypothetical protein [Stenotrophomonas maltophilia]